MIIETTINLNAKDVLLLDEAASSTGNTRSSMIIMLMKKAMKVHGVMLNTSRRVKYQARSNDNIWQPVHVTMPLRDYEFFLDMKKFCKWSISALIANSINMYLKKSMEKCRNENYLSKTDNYHFIHYILSKKIIDGVICWTIYWGLPEKIITSELLL